MSGVATAAKPLARQPQPQIPGREALARLAPPIIGLALGAVLWEVVGQAWKVTFFPPLSAVLTRLGELIGEGKIFENLTFSLRNLAIGYGLAVVIGVGVGMLMGAYRRVEMALDVYVYAMLTAPSLVFAPIFFAVFGLKQIELTILSIIFLYSVWIIIVNTAAAIRQVPLPLIEMGRSLCANERQLFFKIILPAATPLIFAGLRLSMGRAVKGMINGEMFIIAIGLGGVVISAGRRFDAAAVLAVLLVIIIVALVMVKLVQIIDSYVTSWLPSTAKVSRKG
jgi:NitT/TauT family transport system permease protein